VLGVAGLINACGGSSSPTPVSTPTPVAIPSPTPTPTATPTPVAAACPLGKGTVSASCARHTGQFIADVDAAVNRLMSENPALFDFGDVSTPRVKDTTAYYSGVLSN